MKVDNFGQKNISILGASWITILTEKVFRKAQITSIKESSRKEKGQKDF